MTVSGLSHGTQSRSDPHQSHTAHFYWSDFALAAAMGQKLARVLASGGAAAVIATQAHRIAFERQLAACGVSVAEAAIEGRWLALDAFEALSTFMVEGWPDARRFHAEMSGIVEQLASSIKTPDGQVSIYGEMVSVLWEAGKTDASLRIEELWNDLALTRKFHLSCGWPLCFFPRGEEGASIEKICSKHDHVVPAFGCSTMSETAPLQSSAVWQIRAQALEQELQQSRKVQEMLELREAELRDFLENSVVGMQWLAPDGAILWANQTLLDLIGYDSEHFLGHNLSEFAADPAAAQELLDRIGTQKNVLGCEVQLRRHDGTVGWFRFDANAWRQKGEFRHARCFVTDVTSQKTAFEAQMKLAAIVECSDDAIASKDLTGIVTSWNAAAERILGYKAEEIIGKSILTIIPPELHGDEPEILRKIQSGERIEHFETVRMTKAGERIDVSLTVSPVRDANGTVVGAAKILRDVTAHKKLEATLRTTERLASVGRLAATVAHEINNPLEAVTNLIYIARQDPDLPEGARTCLVAADEELQRISHIARQTLGFYRDTSHPVWISVSESVDEVLAVYERRFRYKGISVRLDIPADLRICVLRGEFKQILSNLVSNAIDASKQDQPVHIRARLSQHPATGAKGMRLTVADYGTGISPEYRHRIFTPFFTTKKDVGTGLGLWIVKDLLEKRGGTISCRSRAADSASGKPSGTVMMIFVPTEFCESEHKVL